MLSRSLQDSVNEFVNQQDCTLNTRLGHHETASYSVAPPRQQARRGSDTALIYS